MKLLLISTAVLVILGVGAAVLVNRADDETIVNEQEAVETEQNTEAGVQTFTFNEVKVHNSASDCWLVINDKVYNVTDFIPQHPGGNEILRGCGTDATVLFETRTDNGEAVGSGTPHSSSASSQLESFYIGDLATP